MYILPVIVDYISDIVALVVGVEGGGHPAPDDIAVVQHPRVVEAGDEGPRRLAQVHTVVHGPPGTPSVVRKMQL